MIQFIYGMGSVFLNGCDVVFFFLIFMDLVDRVFDVNAYRSVGRSVCSAPSVGEV